MEEIKEIFESEVLRYFDDGGDDHLRYNYNLDKNSIVFDLGGYKGDFSYIINKKYGCNTFLFEPFDEYMMECRDRFIDNHKILLLNYGVKKCTEKIRIYVDGDGTSVHKSTAVSCLIDMKSLSESMNELDVNHIDLIKINIEGDEYDVLETAINDNIINKISNIQVQFHPWFDDCKERREKITKELEKTHDLQWRYNWVWESWKIK